MDLNFGLEASLEQLVENYGFHKTLQTLFVLSSESLESNVKILFDGGIGGNEAMIAFVYDFPAEMYVDFDGLF